jgi:hypothetical protein
MYDLIDEIENDLDRFVQRFRQPFSLQLREDNGLGVTTRSPKGSKLQRR